MNDGELEDLLADPESQRVERKESANDGEKIRQAICAFANDVDDSRKPGVLFIGIKDDGTCAGLPITDALLLTLAGIKTDGNILPLPSMSVEKRTLRGCPVAVIIVQPSDAPPVKYQGRVWIRTGPRRSIASAQDERALNEKRRFRDLPFDLHDGSLGEVIHRVDEKMEVHIQTAINLTAGPLEIRQPEYPLVALQQFVRNAVMHRVYESTNAPIRMTWFNDRIEIQNPGGPFGQVTKSNFGRAGVTDYRNPHIAESLKVLGYVQRFGVGIQIAQEALRKNGNPPAGFSVEDTSIHVEIKKAS